MVNVANRADVDVGLGPLEPLLAHFKSRTSSDLGALRARMTYLRTRAADRLRSACALADGCVEPRLVQPAPAVRRPPGPTRVKAPSGHPCSIGQVACEQVST